MLHTAGLKGYKLCEAWLTIIGGAAIMDLISNLQFSYLHTSQLSPYVARDEACGCTLDICFITSCFITGCNFSTVRQLEICWFWAWKEASASILTHFGPFLWSFCGLSLLWAIRNLVSSQSGEKQWEDCGKRPKWVRIEAAASFCDSASCGLSCDLSKPIRMREWAEIEATAGSQKEAEMS